MVTGGVTRSSSASMSGRPTYLPAGPSRHPPWTRSSGCDSRSPRPAIWCAAVSLWVDSAIPWLLRLDKSEDLRTLRRPETAFMQRMKLLSSGCSSRATRQSGRSLQQAAAASRRPVGGATRALGARPGPQTPLTCLVRHRVQRFCRVLRSGLAGVNRAFPAKLSIDVFAGQRHHGR